MHLPKICKHNNRTTQNTAYGVIGPVGNSARAREGQTSGTYDITELHLSTFQILKHKET